MSKPERSKKKRGPKPTQIDWAQFDSLCGFQCTLEEISAFFNVSEDTIERICVRDHKLKFADLWRQKAVVGKISLRRSMFKKAQDNPTMMIWLSKNHLGMSDKIEQKLEAEISSDIVYTTSWGGLAEPNDDS